MRLSETHLYKRSVHLSVHPSLRPYLRPSIRWLVSRLVGRSVTPVQKPCFLAFLATVRSYTETNDQPTCFEILLYYSTFHPSIRPSVSPFMSHDQYTQRHSLEASLPGRTCLLINKEVCLFVLFAWYFLQLTNHWMFLVTCKRLYNLLCPSVRWLVGLLVGQSGFTSFIWFISLTSLLLPKWFCDIKYGLWPSARDFGNCVSGLTILEINIRTPNHHYSRQTATTNSKMKEDQ